MKKQVAESQERENQGRLTEEVVNMLKESQKKLLETNAILLEDIKLLKQAQSDKDRLWNMELEDLQKAMSMIKNS